eukprot:COSAG02_NODE_8258_length_2639_cov_1.270866_4_plen_154_part_00
MLLLLSGGFNRECPPLLLNEPCHKHRFVSACLQIQPSALFFKCTRSLGSVLCRLPFRMVGQRLTTEQMTAKQRGRVDNAIELQQRDTLAGGRAELQLMKFVSQFDPRCERFQPSYFTRLHQDTVVEFLRFDCCHFTCSYDGVCIVLLLDRPSR